MGLSLRSLSRYAVLVVTQDGVWIARVEDRQCGDMAGDGEGFGHRACGVGERIGAEVGARQLIAILAGEALAKGGDDALGERFAGARGEGMGEARGLGIVNT